jgi:peptidoglycan/LPS O-acetylase OafA/YrhL
VTEAIYTLTPARMDDLALGALLALAVDTSAAGVRPPKWARPAAGLLTALLVAVFVLERGLRLDSGFFQTIGYTVVSAAAAAYLGLALWSREGAMPRRVLELPLLRACGRWSYGTYVWHGALYYAVCRRPWFLEHPALAGSRLLGALAITGGLVAGGIVLGALSWRFYEKPVLRLGRRVAASACPDLPKPSGRSRPTA